MVILRAIWVTAVLLAGLVPAAAQVSVDHFKGDGTRYVRSCQEVMYDDFFHSATFAVAAHANVGGLVTFTLEVTFDEGMLNVSQGDSLTLVLRGGDRIILTTDRDLSRTDIIKRHYRTYNDYYITCYYPLSSYDIQRITRNRVTKISAQTDDFTFDRKLGKFQDSFRRQFTAVYRFLMGNNSP